MFDIVDIIIPWLGKRHWSLLIADAGSEFVVSDHPVALSWSEPGVPAFYGPGFGMLKTEVTMPLSRRLTLIGTFEPPENHHVTVDRPRVAVVNSRTCGYGERFVCSAEPDFVWLRNDRTVGNAEQLIEMIRARGPLNVA